MYVEHSAIKNVSVLISGKLKYIAIIVYGPSK
jgi:hypothetical protein